ncbi:MAG: septum formation protein Maf [Chloroflexi bacterium]|nr:septum formation protein Maf [Chloroflexota bacterium]
MITHRDHTVNATVLLASASPRRRELIKLLGLPVETTAADIDETPLDHESAANMAIRLSQAKAQSVAALIPDLSIRIIIASDTIVSLDGEPLGKPIDAADARSMLRHLRDRVHQVHTAVTLIDPASDRVITDLATSDVRMRAYSDQEIDDYIASGDPFDKAGAYAIQHSGFKPAENFAHCYANVMGLPLCHVVRSLRKLGIEPVNDVPTACQAYLNYQCPMYESILNSNRSTGE